MGSQRVWHNRSSLAHFTLYRTVQYSTQKHSTGRGCTRAAVYTTHRDWVTCPDTCMRVRSFESSRLQGSCVGDFTTLALTRSCPSDARLRTPLPRAQGSPPVSLQMLSRLLITSSLGLAALLSHSLWLGIMTDTTPNPSEILVWDFQNCLGLLWLDCNTNVCFKTHFFSFLFWTRKLQKFS